MSHPMSQPMSQPMIGFLVMVQHQGSPIRIPHYCRAETSASAVQLVLTKLALQRIPFSGGEITTHAVEGAMFRDALDVEKIRARIVETLGGPSSSIQEIAGKMDALADKLIAAVLG